jgi:hypothetical protein
MIRPKKEASRYVSPRASSTEAFRAGSDWPDNSVIGVEEEFPDPELMSTCSDVGDVATCAPKRAQLPD